MKTNKILSLIKNPNLINSEDNKFLEKISTEYPFFSIPHILLCRGLLNTESVRYNRKLKLAAIYSLDRKHLFKLITQILNSTKSKERLTFKKKEKRNSDKLNQDLYIGKPIKFKEKEEYSFTEWLTITKIKKINREEKDLEKENLIDSFIVNKPRIKAKKNKFFSSTETAKISLIANNEIITETLARVYLEQEHFDKAIDAYQKLSLKYPKKSSFFVNQINLINELKKK